MHWKLDTAPWDMEAFLRGEGRFFSMVARKEEWRGQNPSTLYPSARFAFGSTSPTLHFYPSIDLDRNLVAKLLLEAVSVLRHVAPKRCAFGIERNMFKRDPVWGPGPGEARYESFDDWRETSIIAGFEFAGISRREKDGIKFEEHRLVLSVERLPEAIAPLGWAESLAEAEKIVPGTDRAINADLQRRVFRGGTVEPKN